MSDNGRIIRVEHDKNFTQIFNDCINDKNLNSSTLAVLVYIYSKPTSWVVRTQDLCNRFEFARDKARKILSTLVEFGYARRYQTRDEIGDFAEIITEVCDRPIFKDSDHLAGPCLAGPVFTAPLKTSHINTIDNTNTLFEKKTREQTRACARGSLEQALIEKTSGAAEATFHPEWGTVTIDQDRMAQWASAPPQTPAIWKDQTASTPVCIPNPPTLASQLQQLACLPAGIHPISYNKKSFDMFWQLYPSKKAKMRAFSCWAKAIRVTKIDTILQALYDQIQEKAQKSSLGVFVPEWPHPSTWLNQKRWEDEIDGLNAIQEAVPKSFGAQERQHKKEGLKKAADTSYLSVFMGGVCEKQD